MRRSAEHKINVPLPKAKVTIRFELKLCLSNNSKITQANLTKLHRKIKHIEKIVAFKS